LVVSGPPVLSLSASVLHYQTAAGGPVTTGSTGTTYDSAFSAAPNAVDVPIAWYAAMAIASGINSGVMAALPQTGENLRQVQQRMGLLNIKDQGLRAEAGRFQSECYVPAMAILGRDSIPADVMASQGWDGDNLNWIGAPLFLQRPGYYDVLHARDPVTGFATAAGDVAYVDCKTWWSDPGAGLRARLLVQARSDATITAAVSSLIQSGLDATRRLRALPALAKVPILAMTANAFEDDRERCFEVGMNDHIGKPVAPDLLYSTLLSWLDKAASSDGYTGRL
ncbi:MAG TPA: response regulator, partial [Accumulibacter sp.]|nr:response regulator [Accumulibacter sp.]